MNLHEFNLKRELHSVGQALGGFVIVALVITGIGGTIYRVIAPDGWIAQAFDRSLYAGAAALGSLTLVGVLAWYSRGWSARRTRNRFADLLVYTLAGAGLIYLAQLWLKGAL
jgi:uncharacterized membrane protein YeiH